MFSIKIDIFSGDIMDNKLSKQLWGIYRRGYKVPFEQFHARWKSLDGVALFRHKKTNEPVGFIGLRYHTFNISNRDINTLYFGQVYILPRYYPDIYNPTNGTVAKTKQVLTEQAVLIHPEDLKNSLIARYSKKNPGHSNGEGLILITPMNIKNLLALII